MICRRPVPAPPRKKRLPNAVQAAVKAGYIVREKGIMCNLQKETLKCEIPVKATAVLVSTSKLCDNSVLFGGEVPAGCFSEATVPPLR